jgi:hypothetical protein
MNEHFSNFIVLYQNKLLTKKKVMKKSLLTVFFFLAALFPTFAQMEVNEDVPIETLTLKKGNIPPAILKAADEIFKGNTQVQWGVFPYELKDYGWVVNKEYDSPIDHYEILMKTKDGTDVFAVFESTGELIRYRSVNKNAAIPAKVLAAVAKTQYKDWKVVGGSEVVKNNQKKVVEHYTVKLENGTQKKNLYYTVNGEMLTNK